MILDWENDNVKLWFGLGERYVKLSILFGRTICKVIDLVWENDM